MSKWMKGEFFFVLSLSLASPLLCQDQNEDQNQDQNNTQGDRLALEKLSLEKDPSLFEKRVLTLLNQTDDPHNFYALLKEQRDDSPNEIPRLRILLSLARLFGDTENALSYLISLYRSGSTQPLEEIQLVKELSDIGEDEEAQSLLDEITQKRGTEIDLQELQAYVWIQGGQMKGAKNLLEENSEQLTQLGLLLQGTMYQSTGRVSQYRETLNQMTLRYPNSPESRILKGRGFTTPTLNDFLREREELETFVQVAAMHNRNSAEKTREKLEKLGFSAKIHFIDSFYKILVTSDLTYYELRNRLEQAGYPSFRIYP